jgi:hypothetical protein
MPLRLTPALLTHTPDRDGGRQLPVASALHQGELDQAQVLAVERSDRAVRIAGCLQLRQEHRRDRITPGQHSPDVAADMPRAPRPFTPVTVGLLELPADVLVLPPLAVQPHGAAFYDAEAKLDAGGQHRVAYSRAGLPGLILEQLKDQSLRLWDGLGCRGMARVDFMVTETGTFALEVNTIPGLSYESNFASVASQAGLSHGDIVLALLHEALLHEALLHEALLHEALHRAEREVPLPSWPPLT